MTLSSGSRGLNARWASPLFFVGEVSVDDGPFARPERLLREHQSPLFHVFAPVEDVPYLRVVLEKIGLSGQFNDYACEDWHGVDLCLFRRSRLSNRQQDTLQKAIQQGARVSSLQAWLEERLKWVEIDLLDAEYLLDIEVSGSQSQAWHARLQRSIDVVLSGLVVLLAAIPGLLIALAIKLESPGSVFFLQRRTGLFNREFDIIKFRSMYTDAERNGACWAVKGDSRVTRVGRFIRKTRIDELPQLLNVLKGEMSLIGPRPEREVFIADLEKCIPFYRFRHLVKPGITGFAQVMYTYGASLDDARQKHRYDLYYIKHRSFLLDLQILWRTVRIVLSGQGV